MTAIDEHTVSVVIPTTGRTSLSEVRESLGRQTRPADEICIVEDRARQGPGWARNRGIERTSGDIVAFLDDDTLPPPSWLDAMVRAILEEDADGAGGSFIESDPLLHAVRSLRPLPAERVVDGMGLVGNTGNLLLRRRVLDAVRRPEGGVFIESWGRYGSEDWELIMRIRQKGFRLVFVPVHVRHLRRVNCRSYMIHQFRRGVGVALLHRSIREQGCAARPQESILWDPERSRAVRLLTIVRTKVVGPVNAAHFIHRRHFILHWIAEKFQGFGYLWGMVRHGR